MADEEPFYFESDHLALRGNRDYCSLLRTLAILEAQKTEVVQGIDKLVELKNKYLDDPEDFLKTFTVDGGATQDIPRRVTIVDIPKIDLRRYNVHIPEIPETSAAKTEDLDDLKVRGKTFDQTKPETFNQFWTCEEQKRLEELLLEYPPEEVEMQRFAKIAKALGNRTTKQVASRVQKFFKKLHSVGMPIPGRLPKNSRTTAPKNSRTKRGRFRMSTFFPAHDIPSTLTIPEDDGLPLESCSPVPAPETVFIKTEVQLDGTENDKIVQILEMVKREKLENATAQHVGSKCDVCEESPIVGARWRCKTCDKIDLCSDCMVAQLLTANRHPLEHEISSAVSMLGRERESPLGFEYGCDSDSCSNSMASDFEFLTQSGGT